MTKANQTPEEYRDELVAEVMRLKASDFSTEYQERRIKTLTERLRLMGVTDLTLYAMTMGAASNSHGDAIKIAQKVVAEAMSEAPGIMCSAQDPHGFTCAFTTHPEGTAHSWEK